MEGSIIQIRDSVLARLDVVDMIETAVATRLTNSELVDTESKLIAAIAAQPSIRKPYVTAAEYFDDIGEKDMGASFHNGVVPAVLVEKYQLDKYSSKPSAQISCCENFASYPATTEKLKSPINKDRNRNSVFSKVEKNCPHEALDVLIDGGFVYDGTNKLLVDSDNTRISNHSDVNSFLSHNLAGSIGQTSKVLPGYSILLSARNSGNFYHWHFDILPVLGLVEECGISISEIDNIILTEKESSFHLPMLEILGVRKDQIHTIQPSYEYVRCEKLLLGTIRNKMGMRQPRKHIDWLRSKYLGAGIKKDSSEITSKKIAVIRDRRGYTDTGLVTEFLEQRGYQMFKPENHSYEQQVKIFHNATHVVSPHGAGLALLAYCKPGTVVHEFYGDHVHPCFWAIANSLGLVYHNYNCSAIVDEAVTNSGRGIVERLNRSINVTTDILENMQRI